MPINLLIGLGNPGPRYASTRHNVGFWLIDRVATEFSTIFQQENKFHGEICRIEQGDIRCWLLKPHTFMNRSGLAIIALANFYKIPIENIVIAHDDLDLPVGRIRFKNGGGHGGHNGLKDSIAHLNTPQFKRLRIGIGHPGNRDAVVDYVLNSPSQIDKIEIDKSIESALSVMPLLLTGKFDKAVQTLHTLT
jgi:PTH1 family peptidyl-tRNA hydrolase